jgi:hypothetical protein
LGRSFIAQILKGFTALHKYYLDCGGLTPLFLSGLRRLDAAFDVGGLTAKLTRKRRVFLYE